MIGQYLPLFLYWHLIIFILLCVNCVFTCGIWKQCSYGTDQLRKFRILVELIFLMGINWFSEVGYYIFSRNTIYLQNIDCLIFSGYFIFHWMAISILLGPSTASLDELCQLDHWCHPPPCLLLQSQEQAPYQEDFPGKRERH